ncbi:MAG: hypothetical protein AB1589_20430 [Cyanobacteriota bacterium]
MKYLLLVKAIPDLSRLSKIALMAVTCILMSSGFFPAIAQTSQLEADSMQSPSPSIGNSSSNNNQLPANVQSAVLRDAVQRTSRPLASFRIIEAQKRTWPDGCLGLSEPDMFCTQVIVPGWRVVVTDGQRNWIYRTDESGNTLKLKERNEL